MINRQFGLIHKLNPVRSKVQEVPLGYEAWEFFQHPNHELNNAQIMVGHFTAAAVANHMFDASQRLNEPQPERPLESISQDSREELLKQVISKPSDSDSVFDCSGGSNNSTARAEGKCHSARRYGTKVLYIDSAGEARIWQ